MAQQETPTSREVSTAVPLQEARWLAEDFIRRIHDVCERVAIAGSIRRQRPQVQDIEIVAQPRISQRDEGVLLPVRVSLLQTRIANLLLHHIIQEGPPSKDGKRAPFGPRYWRLVYKTRRLDLFAIEPPADWGVIFTIRTGSAAYTHWLMLQALRKSLQVQDGALWRPAHDAAGKDASVPIPCPEEADFFRELEVDYVPPEQRETPPDQEIASVHAELQQLREAP